MHTRIEQDKKGAYIEYARARYPEITDDTYVIALDDNPPAISFPNMIPKSIQLDHGNWTSKGIGLGLNIETGAVYLIINASTKEHIDAIREKRGLNLEKLL